MSQAEVAERLGVGNIDSTLSRMRAEGIPLPEVTGSCHVCLGPAPAGQTQCEDCAAELAEQLARMGVVSAAPTITAQPDALSVVRTNGQPRATDPFDAPADVVPSDLVRLAHSPLKPELLKVFEMANGLEAPAREEVGKAAIRVARAAGQQATYQALLELASICVKFAARVARAPANGPRV
jgi:hypothetical protein